jgi:hypothetical protein
MGPPSVACGETVLLVPAITAIDSGPEWDLLQQRDDGGGPHR